MTVKHGPDAIPVACEQPCQRRDEINEHCPLDVLRLHCAKVHGGTEIEQKPSGDLAILGVLADIGRVHSRGDIPIDVADIISRLIFAQIGKVDPIAVKEAAIVALQQAIQPADDMPVETLQDALRR